jgi:hypothetical protein
LVRRTCADPKASHTEEETVMRKAYLMAALILAVSVWALSACAQEGTAKKDTVAKPPLSQSQAVLESWNDIGRKLIAIGGRLPR